MKKRVLYINNNMDFGGQQKFVYDVISNIDNNKYLIDVAVYDDNGYYASLLKNKGIKIYVLPSISRHPYKHAKKLNAIIKENKYDIVHQHTHDCSILLNLIVCKLNHIKKIIVHSHASSSKHKLIHYLFKPFLNMIATDKISCGIKAGKWMYYNNFTVINNGIDVNLFRFNDDYRKYYRKKLNIGFNDYVFGSIGRLDSNKNQIFTIKLFNEYHKYNSDSKLVIVGDGPKGSELKELVKKYKLDDCVLFIGKVDDTYKIYSCFDLFVLPSHHEGFPLVLIEAQISGLNCVVSDTVSPETNFSGMIKFISLKSDLSKWITAIDNMGGRYRVDSDSYSIINSVNKIVDIYEE